ncbi:MAG: ATP-binding cassette domain-containing protein [Bifidobacteriaceae bacterium]|jgi:putative ABC transport system ATP-binding protein|nr:ATP-binding cassette domain-containing protein [Bifidobacteriaceae bacterium]
MRIDALDISVMIGRRPVLEAATLTCAPGTMTALVGPSGCGKTTLLQVLGLLVRPTGGEVRLDGQPAQGWMLRRRRGFWRDQAAFILQDHGIVEEESVAFNVTMALGLLGRRAGGDRRKAACALDAVGLSGRDTDLAAQLSGGEKQRLGVARAMYKNASVLFADEPTASLDAANQRMVIDLLEGQAAAGCTVVVATHDPDLAARADVTVDLGRDSVGAPDGDPECEAAPVVGLAAVG